MHGFDPSERQSGRARKDVKRVLVTGAARNVGSKLCQRLLRLGYSVVGVDNFFSGSVKNLAPFLKREGCIFHEESITEPLPLLRQRHGPFTAMLHTVAIISVQWSMDHPEATLRVNHRATVDLHARAHHFGIPAFVFVGSATEYGRELQGAANEEAVGEAPSPYGLSKYLATSHITNSDYGCSLRFFNLYWPTAPASTPYGGVIRLLMTRAIK